MQSIARIKMTAIEPIEASGVKYAPGESFYVSSQAVKDFLVRSKKASEAPDTTPETSEAVDAPGLGTQGEEGGGTAPDTEQPALEESASPKGTTDVQSTSPIRRARRK